METTDHSTLSRLDFITTRWTLLQQNSKMDETTSQNHRRMLVMRYRKAIESYIRAIVADRTEASDLAQDMFLRLMGDTFEKASPGKGRFRDLLKASIRNLIRDHWRRDKVRKARDVDLSLLADDDETAAVDPWTESWRDNLLEMTFDALARHERKKPEGMPYTVLKLRTEHPEASIRELAALCEERTGRPIPPATFRQRLHRARELFVDFLLEEVGRGLDQPTWENVEAELKSLGLLDLLRKYIPNRLGNP